VGHVTRDSTAIEGREKPCNKKRDVRSDAVPKKKPRGRPRRGESRPDKKLNRLARQIRLKSGRAIAELDKQAAWGCKRNSQGNATFWKGYKLHLDITDQGIPVTAIVTGANVHDSQVAIPMEKITEKRVTHLYSLMDAAYDAEPIRQYIEGKGRKAIIDMNRRKNDTRAPFDPATKERFKIRSTSERGNAHLKDWLLPSKIMVRGARKVSFQLLCGVLCLTALKILQVIILPPLEGQAEAA
jgi:IS5 family transposase